MICDGFCHFGTLPNITRLSYSGDNTNSDAPAFAEWKLGFETVLKHKLIHRTSQTIWFKLLKCLIHFATDMIQEVDDCGCVCVRHFLAGTLLRTAKLVWKKMIKLDLAPTCFDLGRGHMQGHSMKCAQPFTQKNGPCYPVATFLRMRRSLQQKNLQITRYMIPTCFMSTTLVIVQLSLAI